MINFLYNFKHYPLILILQSPIILGFVLPILFYNNFYYSEFEVDKSYVVLAKNYYLLSILIINILCLYFLYFNPFKKLKNKIVKIEFLTIILISLFSILSTFISKLFILDLYYYNLLFYIGQHFILILMLLNTTINYRKKDLIIIYFSLFLCNLICLYSGDSKFFLITLITFIIIVSYKFSLKKFLYVIFLSTLLAITVLGLKKIYRDYVHYGGMDKLNYQYTEKNVTYPEIYDYRNAEDFFMKQKLEFLVYNKSYLYSDICSNGYKFQNTIIENLISSLVFENGKYKKNKLNLNFLENFPEIKEFLNLKTQSSCYIFFRFVHRIDFFSPLVQVISEVNELHAVNGKTYIPIFYTFIPRILFENKPIDNADDVYMKLMNNLKNKDDRNRTIISVSILTEAWINFLNNGIFIISFIMGIFYTSILVFILSNNILLKFLGASLIIHVVNLNLSLKQIFSGSYQLFVIFVLFYFLCQVIEIFFSRIVKKNIG
tara:strand:- start:1227 stop:2693 length:1467 start_codon:yes stop_codon:yes gene_type:complete